jgi:ABC-type Fe3+/spermidine/putrescine transport system ATPase subunit
MLLLDEPLSALDEKIRRAVQAELSSVHKRTGTTFLYVTHDQEEALSMSTRVAVLNRGRVAQCDEPERLYKRPRTRFVAEFFRGCNVLQVAPLRAANGRWAYRLAGVVIEAAADDGGDASRTHIAIRSEDLHIGAGAVGLYRTEVLNYIFELGRSRQPTGGGCDRGRGFSPSLSTRWQLANCVMKSPACDAMVCFDLGRASHLLPIPRLRA